MKQKLEQAIKGIFEILSTDQKRRALDFMQEIGLAQEGRAPVQGEIADLLSGNNDETNFLNIEPTMEEMTAAFEACSYIYKFATVGFILDDMASTFQATIELCKYVPSYLGSLPVSTMREIASYEYEKSTEYLLSAFPGKANMLLSMNCLSSFCNQAHDPTGDEIIALQRSLSYLWSLEVQPIEVSVN